MIKQSIENIKTSYKYYRNREIENPVLRDKYYEVVQDFMKFIYNEVEKGKHVELPCRTGYMFIRGYKPKKVQLIDWKTTNEMWVKFPEWREQRRFIYFLNESTGLVTYRFYWSRKDIYCSHKELYHFQLSKPNRRHLRDLIKNGKEYFIKG